MIDRFEFITGLLFPQHTGSECGSSLRGDADLRLGLRRLARVRWQREIVGHWKVSAYPSTWHHSLRLGQHELVGRQPLAAQASARLTCDNAV